MFGLLIIQTMSISTCAAQDTIRNRDYKTISSDMNDGCRIMENKKTGKCLFFADGLIFASHDLDSLMSLYKNRQKNGTHKNRQGNDTQALWVEKTVGTTKMVFVVYLITSKEFGDLYTITWQKIVFTAESSNKKTIEIHGETKPIIASYPWCCCQNKKGIPFYDDAERNEKPLPIEK